MFKCALQTNIIQIKHNIIRIHNWWGTNQLAIYKAWKSWIRDYWKQMQLVAGRRTWTRDRRITNPGPYISTRLRSRPIACLAWRMHEWMGDPNGNTQFRLSFSHLLRLSFRRFLQLCLRPFYCFKWDSMLRPLMRSKSPNNKIWPLKGG